MKPASKGHHLQALQSPPSLPDLEGLDTKMVLTNIIECNAVIRTYIILFYQLKSLYEHKLINTYDDLKR